ncbi:M20/M25/M40 family metallo-hydrolase, partial [Acinetobacter baumannii]
AVEPKLKALGFATQRFDATPSPGVNLLATLKGKGSRKVMLIAHMDTVYLDGTAAKQPFHIDGNRAYGAGIADDKGGMAVALHAARLIVNAGF